MLKVCQRSFSSLELFLVITNAAFLVCKMTFKWANSLQVHWKTEHCYSFVLISVRKLYLLRGFHHILPPKVYLNILILGMLLSVDHEREKPNTEWRQGHP